MSKGFRISLKYIKPTTPGTNPENTGLIFRYMVDSIMTQAGWVGGVMLITDELLRVPITYIETVHRTNPEYARAVFVN